MNWLDPKEVEAWLAEKRDDSWHGHPWKVQALEQFVLSIAKEELQVHAPEEWNGCEWCDAIRVARLLKKAMETNWLAPQEVEAWIGNRVCNCKVFSRGRAPAC